MKKMKKMILPVTLAMLFMLCLWALPNQAQAATASGTCGENATWELTDGVLTISGTGAMENYATASDAPWYSKRSSITKVVVDDGITAIGDRAFYTLDAARTFTFGKDLEKISSKYGIFCKAVTKYAVDPQNPYLCNDAYGVIYSKDMKTLVKAPTYGLSGTYTIADGVTTIGYGAFDRCHYVTTLNMPSTLTTLETEAIHNCLGLTSITFGKNVTSIGDYALGYCYKLQTITFPDTVTYIGRDAFVDTPWEENLSNGMHYIGKVAYRYVGDGAGSITLKSGTKAIAAGAFEGCTSLTAISIPNTVTSIGNRAFSGCSELDQINLPSSVTNIGSYAFSATNVMFMTIPDSVRTLGSYAFSNCETLTAVELGDGLTEIADSTFNGCSALTEIHLGKGITKVGYQAFKGCDWLKNISLEDMSSWLKGDFHYKIMSVGKADKNVYLNDELVTNLVIPGDITAIPEYAFYKCGSVTRLTMGNSVTEIGDSAFCGCDNLKDVTLSTSVSSAKYAFEDIVETLRFPSGTTTVSSANVLNRYNIKRIIVPESVTDLTEAFYGMTALQELYILGNPEIGESCFYGVGADVYTFTPWEAADKKNYGGTPTWKEGQSSVKVLEDAPYFYDLNTPIDSKWFTYGCVDSSGNMIAGGAVGEDAIAEYDNSMPGVKSVTVTVGNQSCQYTYCVIDARKINASTFKAGAVEQVSYTGDPCKPNLNVYFQDILLKKGRDYTLTYANNVKPGSNASVTVQGLGLFGAQKITKAFNISKCDISKTTVSVLKGAVFNGQPQEPTVTVTFNDKTLRENVDYILSYADNVQVGTAKVTVYGIGNYCGQTVENFEITEAQVSNYVDVSYSSSGPITVRDQTIRVDLSGMCLHGYDLYKNGALVDWRSVPSTASSVSGYIHVHMTDQPTGTYLLTCYTQGYTVVVSGGKYIYKASGSRSQKTFTVYRYADAPEITPTMPNELIPGAAVALNLRQFYLPVSAEPEDAMLHPQVWESSDPAVATVNDGVVTMHKAGKATITVLIQGLSTTWEVEATSLNINKATVTNLDDTYQNYVVAYKDEVLTENQDFVKSLQTVNGNEIMVLSGCNLFTGNLLLSANSNLNTWVELNEDWYYIQNGRMVTGWVEIGSKWYYFDNDGVMQSGWKQIADTWYYFSEAGIMQTGWVQSDNQWYYMDSSGAMQTGWQQLSGKWYYFSTGGAMQTGWQSIGGIWYYFNSSGYMLTGWQQVDGKWYYFNSSGAMKTGWQQLSGKWYYLNNEMKTNWQRIGGKWYFLGSDGAMRTGWQKYDGSWYYLNSSGHMLTGWQKIGGSWYYLGTNGVMYTGWLKQGGSWYYLNSSGIMLTGTHTIGGITYTFNSNGVWIS